MTNGTCWSDASDDVAAPKDVQPELGITMKSTRSARRRKARQAARSIESASTTSGTTASGSEEDLHSRTKLNSQALPPTAVAKAKLNSQALPFVPKSAASSEVLHRQDVSTIIGSVVKALSSAEEAQKVRTTEASMGRSVTLHAELRQSVASFAKSRHAAAHSLKALAKQAFLDATSQCPHTYLIGYLDRPFTDAGDCSFSAAIASVPPSEEARACWHYYQRGFCPCSQSCTFRHPDAKELTRVWVTCSK